MKEFTLSLHRDFELLNSVRTVGMARLKTPEVTRMNFALGDYQNLQRSGAEHYGMNLEWSSSKFTF